MENNLRSNFSHDILCYSQHTLQSRIDRGVVIVGGFERSPKLNSWGVAIKGRACRMSQKHCSLHTCQHTNRHVNNVGCGGCHIPNLLSSRKILRQSEIQACLETPLSCIAFPKRLELSNCHSCLSLKIITTIIYTYLNRFASSENTYFTCQK